MKKEREIPSRAALLRRDLTLFGRLRALLLAGVLIAMSIVLGKFLQIPNPFQNIIRLSFENLPVLFAGVTMGPFIGGAVGALADLIGCLCYGYAINPMITLGALTVGVVSGVSAHYLVRRPAGLRVALATALAHLFGSVVVKSLGLAQWYLSSYNMGLFALMGWRALTYLIVGTAEGVLLYILLSNRALAKQLERMMNA